MHLKDDTASAMALWSRVLEHDMLAVHALQDNYPEQRSITIPFEALISPEILDEMPADVIDHPEAMLRHGNRALAAAMCKDKYVDPILRINKLPADLKLPIRAIRQTAIGRLVAIDGLVKRTTQVKFKCRIARFKCERCPGDSGNLIDVVQDADYMKTPLECPYCQRTAGSTKFTFIGNSSSFIDVQKIEIQENPEHLRGGAQPEHIVAFLTDDLCGSVHPGDRVTFNGWVAVTNTKETPTDVTFDLHLKVLSIDRTDCEFEDVELSEEDVQAIKKAAADPDINMNMVRSICPAIYGYTELKEAIAMQLFGGTTKHLDDGTRLRGDIHILVVGDPGVAKSTILQYTKELAPRAVYTSGKSSSSAGLTAAAVKDDFDDGRWTLEAGALVIADGGLACCDELDKMKPEDRSAMHQAMEEQKITVAKAGIQATLQCRCSILAAANPEMGRFNEAEPLVTQIALEPPLLSRFDLIFAYTDKPEAQRDQDIAAHMLKNHKRGQAIRSKRSDVLDQTSEVAPVFNKEFMRKYIAYARGITPMLTDEAMAMIQKEYLKIRAKSGAGIITITPRQLDAYIRLSEASARMRLSEVVEPQDVVNAVNVVNHYLSRLKTSGGVDSVVSYIPTNQAGRHQAVKNLLKTGGRMPLVDLKGKAFDVNAMSAADFDKTYARMVESGEILRHGDGTVSYVGMD